MRLQAKEVDAIAQAARNTFAPGTEVFLFGSRQLMRHGLWRRYVRIGETVWKLETAELT